ncbi:MAG: hypothetical protein LBM19_02815 [Holosporales bacterium]|nr:hypothetical protein [Holosporales bacterium]
MRNAKKYLLGLLITTLSTSCYAATGEFAPPSTAGTSTSSEFFPDTIAATEEDLPPPQLAELEATPVEAEAAAPAIDDAQPAAEAAAMETSYTVTFPIPEGSVDAEIAAQIGMTAPTEPIQIPNGSVLLYAGDSFGESVVRFASRWNDIPNPLCINHVEIVINDIPNTIRGIIQGLMTDGEGYLTTEEGNRMLEDIPEGTDVRPFTLGANATFRDFFSGRGSGVRLYRLETMPELYEGNVYLRTLTEEIPTETTQNFLKEYLGRPYESITTVMEMMRAVRGGNETEEEDRVFCSELAALFYEEAKVIADEVASNALPEMFSSRAGENDLLAEKASDEIPLKLQEADLIESDSE